MSDKSGRIGFTFYVSFCFASLSLFFFLVLSSPRSRDLFSSRSHETDVDEHWREMGRCCDRLGLHVYSITTILNLVLVLFSEYRALRQAPLLNAFDVDTIHFSRCNMDYKYLFIGSDPWRGLPWEQNIHAV